MKLPFTQFPELAPGHGLVVGAPRAGGRTFFLALLAQEALEQGKEVCFIGYGVGCAWMYELLQKRHEKLLFLDCVGAPLSIELLDQMLIKAVGTDLVIIDNFDALALFVTAHAQLGKPMSATEYMSTRLHSMLKALNGTQANAVVSIELNNNALIAAPAENGSSWNWDRMHITPIVHEHALADIKNLTAIRLVKSYRPMQVLPETT